MRVLDIAQKDLCQLVGNWQTALFLLIMPIGFTLLFAFVFGSGSTAEDPRLPVGIIDQDGDSVLGSHLLDLIEGSETIRPVLLEDADLQEAERQVAEEELPALVIVPLGFSQQGLSPSAKETPTPIVVVDLNSSAGQAAHNGLQAAFVRLLGAVEAARLTAQAYEAQDGAIDQTFLSGTLARAIQAWDDPPLTVTIGQSGALADQDKGTFPPNDYAHSSAGIMVQFAMAGLTGAAAIIVAERKTGTMLRLLTTPVTRIEIILGHFLAMFLMILVQLVVLILFGQLLLRVGYLRVPLATLLMLLTTAFWSASLGLLIGVFARTEEQVIIYTIILMLLLSGLGGAWMPLELTGKTFQTVGHFLPTAWAIEGFENIVVRGLDLESVLLPAGIVFAFALAFFAVSLWRFRFE